MSRPRDGVTCTSLVPNRGSTTVRRLVFLRLPPDLATTSEPSLARRWTPVARSRKASDVEGQKQGRSHDGEAAPAASTRQRPKPSAQVLLGRAQG
jgi:hypothetical protein